MLVLDLQSLRLGKFFLLVEHLSAEQRREARKLRSIIQELLMQFASRNVGPGHAISRERLRHRYRSRGMQIPLLFRGSDRTTALAAPGWAMDRRRHNPGH